MSKEPEPEKRLTPKQRRVLTDKWKYPSHTFGTAVLELGDCGFIDPESIQQFDTNVYACTVSNHGYAAAARELAYLLPGQIRPLKNGKGLVWLNGSKGAPHGVLFDWDAHRDLTEARNALSRAFPVDSVPWTIGGCVNKVVQFIGVKQEYEKSAEFLISGIPYGYHECTPGRYDNGGIPRHLLTGFSKPEQKPKEHLFDFAAEAYEHSEPEYEPNPEYIPALTMYDVEGYYFSMLQRLPSLFCSASPWGIDFFPMNRELKTVWKDTLSLVADCKILRNSLAGCFAGSLKRGTAYCRDLTNGKVKRIHPPGNPGPFRAAGLLIVRTGVELCYIEAVDNNAVYATIDSVVLRGNAKPTVWPGHGFRVDKKAAGNAELCHRGSYKIGAKQTVHYKNGEREYIPADRQEIPVKYKSFWL